MFKKWDMTHLLFHAVKEYNNLSRGFRRKIKMSNKKIDWENAEIIDSGIDFYTGNLYIEFKEHEVKQDEQ
jgi:hypothetical protein